MKIEIYLVENIDNNPNKVYIGKTKLSSRRAQNHREKFGKNILFNVIDEIECVEREDWKNLESFWIEQFKQWGFELVNKNKGGGGPETHNKEARELFSKLHTNNTYRRGKTQSEEAKLRISKAREGIKFTEEHKRKISAAHKGVPSKIVVCPHCNTAGGINVMHKWHFNNCKLR